MNSKIVILLLLLGLGAGGGYYYWSGQQQSIPESAATPIKLAPMEAPKPEITFPIEKVAAVPLPEPRTIEKPLPDLAGSDAVITHWLANVTGPALFQDFLVSEQIIPRIVATIDNLTNPQIPVKISPVSSASGKLVVGHDDGNLILDVQNHTRYDRHLALAGMLDAELLVSTYVRFYPLFQQAYEELGYPELYFNDRLVEVIDHLLQTPEPAGSVYLIKPEAYYLFADPALERLSGGQKILLRMGPENAALVKHKLGQIRDLIGGRSASLR